MKRISIVVSCYNIERYIARCLDSLLEQDISHDEYEIICVNDCSTDTTRNIIVEYKNKYPNILLIDHDFNKKLGTTRNTGSNAAQGKYIWFVDGDDMIKRNVLSTILSICEKEKLDELLFNHERINQVGQFIERDATFNFESKVVSGFEYVNTYFYRSLSKLSIIWNHIHRTAFLRDNNLRSPEINMGEDGPLSWRTILYAERIKSVADCFYQYRCNDGSMTVEFQTKPTVYKLFEKSFEFGAEVIRLSNEIQLMNKDFSDELLQIAVYAVNSFTDNLLKKYTLKEKREFINLWKEKQHSANIVVPYLTNRNKRIIGSIQYGLNLSLLYLFAEKNRK